MRIPSWMIWYKKPDYRDIKEYATEISAGRRSFSPDGRARVAIPSRLRLERILANKTCSPMSFYDFYMYLKYIEFSPENLEFYVWFKNYELAYSKFAKAGSPSVSEKDAESIEPKPASRDGSVMAQVLEKLPSVNVSQMSWNPEIGPDTLAHIAHMISLNVTLASTSPNHGMGSVVPPQPKCAGGKCEAPSSSGGASDAASTSSTQPLFTSGLGASAELRAVVKTYLLPGSEKELNIPSSMRSDALQALQQHQEQYINAPPNSDAAAGYINPDVLRPIADHAYLLLKNCSHRNFVRLGVSNGTYETICVATALGIILTAGGFLLMLLRALHPRIGSHSRWEAFAAWPLWWMGMSLVLSGLRGSCFFLLLFARRQRLPWERFDDDEGIAQPGSPLPGGDDPGAAVAVHATGGRRKKKNPVLRALSRLMIFDRKLKVKDEHLRRLQTKIVVQSLVSGALFATVGVLFFLFLPVWIETVAR